MSCKLKACNNKCCYECDHSKECFSEDKGCSYFRDLEFNFGRNYKECTNYKKEE